MQQQDDTQQAAELRLAFLRHLPKRLEMLRKRGQRLCDQGWDINALTLLFREVQPLAGAWGDGFDELAGGSSECVVDADAICTWS